MFLFITLILEIFSQNIEAVIALFNLASNVDLKKLTLTRRRPGKLNFPREAIFYRGSNVKE
jgi:hypothetical protein